MNEGPVMEHGLPSIPVPEASGKQAGQPWWQGGDEREDGYGFPGFGVPNAAFPGSAGLPNFGNQGDVHGLGQTFNATPNYRAGAVEHQVLGSGPMAGPQMRENLGLTGNPMRDNLGNPMRDHLGNPVRDNLGAPMRDQFNAGPGRDNYSTGGGPMRDAFGSHPTRDNYSTSGGPMRDNYSHAAGPMRDALGGPMRDNFPNSGAGGGFGAGFQREPMGGAFGASFQREPMGGGPLGSGPMGSGPMREPMREPMAGLGGGPTGGMGWRRMLDSREGEPEEYTSRGTRNKARSREAGNKGL